MVWRLIRQSSRFPATPSLRQYATIGSETRAQSIASILALPTTDANQRPRTIEVTGHVRTIRNQKRRSFLEIGDGSTIKSIQALLEPAQAVKYVSFYKLLRNGSPSSNVLKLTHYPAHT